MVQPTSSLNRSKVQKLLPLFVLLVGFGITTILWQHELTQLEKLSHAQLSKDVLERQFAIEAQLLHVLDELSSIQSFYESSNYVDASEFETFTRKNFQGIPATKAVLYAPVINKLDTKEFEEQLEKEHQVEIALSLNQSKDRHWSVLGDEVHLPIKYALPYQEFGPLTGFDLLGQSDVMRLVAKSVDENGVVLGTWPPRSLMQAPLLYSRPALSFLITR